MDRSLGLCIVLTPDELLPRKRHFREMKNEKFMGEIGTTWLEIKNELRFEGHYVNYLVTGNNVFHPW